MRRVRTHLTRTRERSCVGLCARNDEDERAEHERLRSVRRVRVACEGRARGWGKRCARQLVPVLHERLPQTRNVTALRDGSKELPRTLADRTVAIERFTGEFGLERRVRSEPARNDVCMLRAHAPPVEPRDPGSY